MGPQLYRCGNLCQFRKSLPAWILLQWGRNFIVAEISSSLDDIVLNASSLQWGRNFIVAEITMIYSGHTKANLASMGPQLYRCGNS